LIDHAVDVLVLGNLTEAGEQEWLTRVSLGVKPLLVLEFWDEDAMFTEAGPVSKRVATLWEAQGFATSCANIKSTQVGGVLDRQWLVVARYPEDDERSPLEWPTIDQEVRRPMSNCFQPTGIPGNAYCRDLTSNKARLQYPLSIPNSERDPMPSWPGALVHTPKGTRRLLNDELARGQGTPKAWLEDVYPHSKTVRRTHAVHLLEYLGQLFLNKKLTSPAHPGTSRPPRKTPPQTKHESLVWKLPDFGPTSEWTRERVFNLIRAAILYEQPGVGGHRARTSGSPSPPLKL
jgi:hypothetical protein